MIKWRRLIARSWLMSKLHYRLRGLEIDGAPVVGIVLRDALIIDLAAANTNEPYPVPPGRSRTHDAPDPRSSTKAHG